MKRVVSVSLGSSLRDHRVQVPIMGQMFEIERKGTDGDKDRAVQLIRELDGKVDAFGMGGIDLYLNAGSKRYVIRDALPLMHAANISPMADGTFVKNTLERKVIKYIRDINIVNFKGKKVFLVCGMDRFGMGEALTDAGCIMTYGDAMFSLGWNLPIHSMKSLHMIAEILAPFACRMPIEKIYPIGYDQETINPRYTRYFEENDIIAGDYLYIKKYMPSGLKGKTVITNTVTSDDVEDLRERGVSILITTTPEFKGRSFGTNVIEGVLSVISGKRPEAIEKKEMEDLLDKIGFLPRIEFLNPVEKYAIH